MDFLPEPDRGCHRTGFEKNCRDLVASGRCKRWLQIQGHNPNTGEPVNRWNCIDDWMPLLTIENSQMQRQTGAAVESLRNEIVQGQERQLNFLLTVNGGQPRLIDVTPRQGHQPK